jgi:1,4-alpha-glucan branching enzyme
VPLPEGGRWREVLNTDAAEYGGSGIGNLGAVDAVEELLHGRPFSAGVTLPPLATVWLAPER